jgi:hypothetical protein
MRRSAHDRLPVTGGRRRSERIDLDFMPPPFESVNIAARYCAGRQHIHQPMPCGKRDWGEIVGWKTFSA